MYFAFIVFFFLFSRSGADWIPVVPSSQVQPFPEGRLFATSCKSNDHNQTVSYVFGGFDEFTGEDLNELWKYNSLTKRWTLLSVELAPPPRYYSVCWVDPTNSSRLYIFSGFQNGTQTPNDLWQWTATDDNSGVWAQMATNNPIGRYASGTWISGTKLMLWCGLNDTHYMSRIVWSYDPITNLWTDLITDDPRPPQRYSPSVWTTDLGAYIFGGVRAVTEEDLQDTWVFYPLSDTEGAWLQLVPDDGIIPPPRTDAGTWVGADGKLYLYGGFYNRTTFPIDFWSFNTATLRWTEHSEFISLLMTPGSVSWTSASQIYLFGGTMIFYLGDPHMFQLPNPPFKAVTSSISSTVASSSTTSTTSATAVPVSIPSVSSNLPKSILLVILPMLLGMV